VQICNTGGTGFGACVCADAGSLDDEGGLDDAPILQDLPSDEGTDPGVEDVTGDLPVEDDGGVTDEGGEGDDGASSEDVGPSLCEPPLEIIPAETYGLPFSLVQLTAQGGTGSYRFELLDDQSGAIVNSLTGDVLVGPNLGVTDQIRLTDLGCEGSSDSLIHVVEAMVVAPTNITLSPGGSFIFSVSEGSGTYNFEVIYGDGTINNLGEYLAPEIEGFDQIQVLDMGTGQIVLVDVNIQWGASFDVHPQHLFLPTHSSIEHSYEIQVIGGSGHFYVGGVTGGIEVDGTTITATESGVNQLILTDQFTGQTATMKVTAIPPQPYPAQLQGPREIFNGYIRDVGDLNNDGFNDAAVSYAAWSESAYRTGAVYIYAGSETGLQPDPVRVFSGDFREDYMGHRFVTEDFNEDGVTDIAIGIRLSDIDRSNAGAVLMYYGVEGGFFEAEPSKLWTGESSSDQFGRSLTACDFNGDGHLDMAVGADQRNDPDAGVSDTGAVYIFLGNGNGIANSAAQTLYGRVMNGQGEWWAKVDTDAGFDVSSGYIDDDSLCDLVVYMNDTTNGSGDDGALHIYRGREANGFFPGGVESIPSVIIGEAMPILTTQYIGRNSVVGDVNGDGLDDVIVGSPYYRNGVQGGSAVGALHMFSGADLQSGPATSITEVSSLTVLKIGTSTDYVAQSLQIGDFDGQPPLDIISGDYTDENLNASSSGLVEIYLGQQDGWPTLDGDHQLEGSGAKRFGFAVAIISDADGDFIPDVLAVNERDDGLGTEMGRPYFFSGADILADPLNPEIWQPLNWTVKSGGQRFGRGVALAPDFNNSGSAQLIASAPLDAGNSWEEGAAFVFTNPGDLSETAPDQTLNSTPYISSADWMGDTMAADGDFDGDGLPDLAVAARIDHRPGSFPTGTYYMTPGSPPSCTGGVADVGSVSVYKGLSNGSYDATPMFVFFGSEYDHEIRELRYAGDVDGDGADDLIIGSFTYEDPVGDDEGAFMIVKGREPDLGASGKISVICTHDFIYHGHTNDIHVGWSVAGIGDVNQDGCDDFAVGADDEDEGASNQGSVRVFFGASQTNSNCPSTWTYLFMVPGVPNAHAGQALDGGFDVDGDGIPDMVVGGYEHRVNNVATGGVWLVSGAHIASLQGDAVPAQTGVAPDESEIHLFGVFGSDANILIEGDTAGEEFGFSVALAPGLGPDGSAAVVVGRPRAAISGVSRSGGASIHVYRPVSGLDAGGLDPTPTWVLSGESGHPDSLLGRDVDAVSTGTHAFIAIGGEYGESDPGIPSVDTGAVYVLKIELPTDP
jgi:hypothetical protein